MRYNYKKFNNVLRCAFLLGWMIFTSIMFFLLAIYVLPYEGKGKYFINTMFLLMLVAYPPESLKIISVLKTKIAVDDSGIHFSSLFKKSHIKWGDIVKVKRNRNGFDRFETLGVEITMRGGKALFIHGFLKCESKDKRSYPEIEGIEYFVQELRDYLDPGIFMKY